MFRSIFIVLLAIFMSYSLYINAEETGDFYPGMITICFSKDLIGNTIGDFEITLKDGIINTPYDWFNELAEHYEIIELTQNYKVKHRDWHRDGRYPMNVFTISIKEDDKTDELINELENQKDILFAERKGINRLFYIPNDPFIPQQWALPLIKAFDAWDIQHGGSSEVIIGIVDSGVKWNHPDIAANMWINEAELPGIEINWETGEITGGDGIDNDGNGYIDDVMGWNFSTDGADNNPYIDGGEYLEIAIHGTHVAGCAAAVGDNGVGIAGPAYNAKILATKQAWNSWENDHWYQGIYYLTDTGAHIINASFGFPNGNANDGNLVASYAKAHGSLLVAAAGNYNQNSAVEICYPAAATDALGVIATSWSDYKAMFSNYGTAYDISAPGDQIYSTTFNNSGNDIYQNMMGTSMASPIVAGVAALVKSQNMDMSVDELVGYLLEGTDPIDHLNPGYEGLLGAGRVNAYNSVMLARQPDPQPEFTINPVSFDFEETIIEETSEPQLFTITNSGGSPLTIQDISLVGLCPDEFALISPEDALGVYSVGESKVFSVIFAPTSIGDKSVFIEIIDDLAQTTRNTNYVLLTGTAIPPTSEQDITEPLITKLIGNYPNPFNPETIINFSLSVASNLRVDIYNIKGQKVKSLLNEQRLAGNHNIVWNGKDDNGLDVGSGIYLYKMETDDFVAIRKMVLMK